MGRKSKLTPDQWNEIQKRVIEGESIRSLSKQYGVAYSTIQERIADQTIQIKSVAHQIVNTERALAALPISGQITAQNLASKLRAISDNLANAAHYGAINAHKLSSLANSQLSNITDDMMIDAESLRGISALTSMANEASKIPLGLLAANKDQMQKQGDVNSNSLKQMTDEELYAIASGSC